MTRAQLQAHTADLVRPTWGQHEAPLGDMVTALHNPNASDVQVETAVFAFLDHWGNHVVYRKTARYGLILHVMRDHLNQFDVRPGRFDAHVQKLGYADTAEWYRNYTRADDPVQQFEDVPMFEVPA